MHDFYAKDIFTLSPVRLQLQYFGNLFSNRVKFILLKIQYAAAIINNEYKGLR